MLLRSFRRTIQDSIQATIAFTPHPSLYRTAEARTEPFRRIILSGLARESLKALGHRRCLGTILAYYLFHFFSDDLVACHFE
jgi:phosphoenolpyruvate synthase/pyruvate phosphate dikinase